MIGQDTQHTARALVLYGSADLDAQDLGHAYLSSMDLADFERPYGLGSRRGGARPASLVVRDISRLLALTGSPTVIAFDQIDTLVAQSGGSAIAAAGALDAAAASMLGQVTNGLMALRETDPSRPDRGRLSAGHLEDHPSGGGRLGAGPVPRGTVHGTGLQRQGRHGDRSQAVGGPLRRRGFPAAVPDLARSASSPSPRRRTSRRGHC